MNNPCALAIVGRVNGKPHDPVYDFLDKVPTELLELVSSNDSIPHFLQKVFIISLASGLSSDAFQQYFPEITTHQVFKTFSSQIQSYSRHMRKIDHKKQCNSIVGLKRSRDELQMDYAAKDAECHAKDVEIERLKNLLERRNDDSDSMCTDSFASEPEIEPTKRVKLDWRVDDLRTALLRIKKEQKTSPLDAIEEEFERTILPAMKALPGKSLGLPKNSAEGKQLEYVCIVGAMLKRMSKDKLIQLKEVFDRKKKEVNPKSKVSAWSAFALSHQYEYKIHTSSKTDYLNSL